MKKSFTSLKIFLGVLVAVLAFGYTTAIASTVTLNITGPSPATVVSGSTFTITATATTNYFFGMQNAKFYDYTGTIINTDATSSPYNSNVITAPTTPGSYTYTVVALDKNGATSTKTITITVVANNAPTVTAGSNCGTGTVVLSASDTPVGNTYSYNWYAVSSGGVALQSSTSNTYTTPSISSTTTYYVSYTSGGITSARTPVVATINAVPNANFTSPAYTIVNAATTLTLAVAIPGGTTVSPSFADGSITSIVGTNIQASWPTPGVKQLTLTLTSSSGCTSSYSTSIIVTQNVTAANYAFNQPITLNTSLTGISTTLSNFPALVYIKENALIASGGSLPNCATNVQSPTGGTNGYDFAFTLNGSTNELFYQVESYDPLSGTLLVWVQLPTVTSTNSSLTFYFGSSNPNHTTAFTQATWANDYQAVYHFNEPLANAVVLDATANARNAGQINTVQGTGEIHSAAGITGGGYVFDGSSSEIISTAHADLTGSFTLSGWVNMVSPLANNDQKVVSNEFSSGNGGYKLSLYGTSTANMKAEVETRDALGNATINRSSPGGTILSGGTWYYVQGVYDNTSNTFYTYINGAVDRSLNPAAAAATGGDIYMGTDYNNVNWFQGTMNEIRISNVVKSPDWIKAEYYNQKHPTLFTTCGTVITGVAANSQPIGGAIVYTWTGTGGSSPYVASNWTSSAVGTPTGVPPFDVTCTLNIPGGLGTYPILSANISVYGLTMGAGAKITLGDYTLSVGCHIYNNASGTAGFITSTSLGGVNFNGSLATQNYYCSPTQANTIANLTLNNSAAGTLDIFGSGASNVTVSNLLTITKGNIVIDPTGSLLLTSTSTGSANVAIIPSPYTISGNVTVQRYIPGGTAAYRAYRLLTLPVNVSNLTNNQTSTVGVIDLHSLNAGIITAGPGSGFSYIPATANPLMYLYDENRSQKFTAYVAGKNVGIYSLATGSPYQDTYYPNGAAALPAPTAKATVPVGNSVQVYYVGPYVASPVLTATAPAAATTSATGYLNQGTIPVHIFSTGSTSLSYSPAVNTLPAQGLGLNQVGNPYPSTIDLDSVYYDNGPSNGSNINPIFWELKQPTNTFVAYSASSHAASTAGSGAGPYIASGQGFFVGATNTSKTLTFYEKEKVNVQLTSSTTPALILSQRIKNVSSLDAGNSISAAEALPSGLAGLHLQIAKDTATYTQTGIYFNHVWADKYTPAEDAIDLDGTAPKVFLSSYSSDGIRLCINQLGDYSKGKTIKLYASATTSGNYTISLADINNIDPLYNVYLRDHKLNDSVDMRTANSYSFNIATGDTTTYGANRFDLVVEQRALPPYQLLSFAGQKVNTGVQLNWKANNAGNYTGFILEKQVSNNNYTPIYTIQSDSSTTYNFVDKNPIEGANVYRLEQNDINGNITYSSAVTIGYNNVSSNGFFSVYPNPSKDVINILVNSTTATSPNYTADIYNTSGVLIDHRVLNTYTWTENISSYKEGVYIIALKNTNGDVMAKSKFIKTK